MTQGIIPITFGAFGEFNTQCMDDIITTLSVLGATTDEGLNLTPQHDKTGPFRLLKQKYRQALGVMAVRVHTDLKLKRLRFIQPTEQRARAAVAAQRANFSGDGYQRNAPPWFSSRYHDPFRSYDEWRTSNRRGETPFF